ncbi:hypothetical protein FKG94_03400 [Exilibacterium tricleocarpae]|uniref:Tryptophan synthase subunit beta like protein n=1 Tax=Exilibacterium tricleocarpae TaxID=2591008 RepID=A0A545U713_9GAMM|nr:hypothetical protein [Exilibacterium tricleocarpae]TQV85244.1 hypothetical protein FKG94_03400 [Exilibacterium tricleocarpae]
MPGVIVNREAAMPYVQRDADGKVIALLHAQADHEEHLSATHPDVVAFLSAEQSDASPLLALAESDAEIARVTEDLIHLLIAKNLILFTDLPAAVQQKLLVREKLRSSLQDSIENFLDDSESL